MRFIFCSNCQTFVTLTPEKGKCGCKLTCAQLVDGYSVYTGDFAVPLDIPDDQLSAKSNLFDKKSVKGHNNSHQEIDKQFFTQVIEYLNERAKTQFSTKFPSGASTLILSRRNEYRLNTEAFRKIIDNKVSQWEGTPRAVFLRPKTLFGKTNFENYLGEIQYVKDEGTATDLFTRFAGQVEKAKGFLSGGGQQPAQLDSAKEGD